MKLALLTRRLIPGQRFELRTLLAIAAVAAGLWVFVELADEVMEGGTHAFDESLLLMLRTPDDVSDPIGPGWVEEAGRDFTALGGISVLSLVTLMVGGLLVLQGKKRAALLVLVAVGGGLLLSTLMKAGFDRPRPDLVPHGSIVYTASFPSGHSMLSAVVYLTLGALLLRTLQHRRVKIFVLACAVLLTLLVGISRVYLGVHWPTDVLAGWTAGALWAAMCWLVASWMQREGRVETETGALQPSAGD
jgi:undecaprenyl-diphosphatase